MTLPELATERLWLRPLAIGDVGDLHAVFGDPVCMRFWHRPIATTPGDSRRYVQDMLDHDAGNWAIGCHGSAAVKGFVGFVNGLEPGGHAGFGYAIRRDEWGRGLVVEAARAALDHGFGACGPGGCARSSSPTTTATASGWSHRQVRSADPRYATRGPWRSERGSTG